MSAETDREGRPWQDRETLRRLYVDEGLHTHQIAARLGCSKQTVSRWLNRHDIETAGVGKRNEYSDADIVAHLRWLDAGLPGRPATDDVTAASRGPSRTTIFERFDTLAAALDAAGIDPDAPTTVERRRERERAAYRETLGEGHGAYLQAHPTAAHRLRRTSDPFRFADVDIPDSFFYGCIDRGLLTHAADAPESGRADNGVKYRRWTWTVADGVRAWIAAHVDPPGECPAPDCRAGGITNLGGGAYTCSNDDCDSRFDRETAAEVLGR